MIMDSLSAVAEMVALVFTEIVIKELTELVIVNGSCFTHSIIHQVLVS